MFIYFIYVTHIVLKPWWNASLPRNMFEDFTNSTAHSEHLIFDGIQQMPVMPREDHRSTEDKSSIYSEPKYYLGAYKLCVLQVRQRSEN